MKRAWLYGMALSCFCAVAAAQVPETGRWQELRFASDDVDSHSEDGYIEIVVGLAAKGQLDDDPPLLARARAIGAGLIRAAQALKPASLSWQWEIHTSSAADIEAFCMAGGKILVGSAFVRALALDDGELATLLGHEIAHAVAEHHREELSEALFLTQQPRPPLDVLIQRLDSDPSLWMRLAGLSRLQESEADQLGMVLAHKAGWPSAPMLSLYAKLAAVDAPAPLSSHPPASARLSMAKGMALLFAGEP